MCGLEDAVDLVRHLVALFLQRALGPLLLQRGSTQPGVAPASQGRALSFFVGLQCLRHLGALLMRESLHGQRFTFRRSGQALLLLVGAGQVAAVHHVQLLLGDALFLQPGVGLRGVAACVDVFGQQRRHGIGAQVQRCRGRRHFGRRQCHGRLLGRHSGWRALHVGEGFHHRVLVALHHLQHIGGHVLRLFVALEVVNVLDAARHVVCQRCLQLAARHRRVHWRRRARAHRVHMGAVAARLAFARRHHHGVFGLLQLLRRVVVRLLVAAQARECADAARQHRRGLGHQVLRHLTAHQLQARTRTRAAWAGGAAGAPAAPGSCFGLGRLARGLVCGLAHLRHGLGRRAAAQPLLRLRRIGFQLRGLRARHVVRQFDDTPVTHAVQVFSQVDDVALHRRQSRVRRQRHGRDVAAPRRALLQRVHQFVRDELPAGRSFWLVGAGAEVDVRTGREGTRAQRGAERGRLGTGVHPHGAKVGVQTRLHELAQAR